MYSVKNAFFAWLHKASLIGDAALLAISCLPGDIVLYGSQQLWNTYCMYQLFP